MLVRNNLGQFEAFGENIPRKEIWTKFNRSEKRREYNRLWTKLHRKPNKRPYGYTTIHATKH